MPLLHSLTLKIKNKFGSPPASPTTQSPKSSFEAVGRQKMQRTGSQTTIQTMASAASQESGSGSMDMSSHVKPGMVEIEKGGEERRQRRQSKFREDL
jgi:hypothetical protein